MTLNNKILQLPSEQITWLSLIKDIFKRTFRSDNINKRELIIAIETKALERGYDDIVLNLSTKELDEYFNN